MAKIARINTWISTLCQNLGSPSLTLWPRRAARISGSTASSTTSSAPSHGPMLNARPAGFAVDMLALIAASLILFAEQARRAQQQDNRHQQHRRGAGDGWA